MVLIFSLLFIFIYKYQQSKSDGPDQYTILERTGSTAQDPGWQKAKNQSYALIRAIQDKPKDITFKTKLAMLYIQEARITGNYAYYDKAAMKYVNDALSIDASNFDAMVLKSLLYLSQHHFADGLEAAQKAKAVKSIQLICIWFVCGWRCGDGQLQSGGGRSR